MFLAHRGDAGRVKVIMFARNEIPGYLPSGAHPGPRGREPDDVHPGSCDHREAGKANEVRDASRARFARDCS